MTPAAQPEGLACLIGIAPWKRRRIATMLRNRHGPAIARDPARAVAIARERGGAIGCWATRVPPGLEDAAEDAKVPLWWIGMLMNIFGELGNLLAYGFAPASLVAPVGCVGVFANEIIAVVFLKEPFRKQDVVGLVGVIIGVILIARVI